MRKLLCLIILLLFLHPTFAQKKLVDSLYREAFKLYSKQDKQGALNIFDKIISIKPKETVAWEAKALIFSEWKQYANAAYSYKQLVQLKPQVASYWNSGGWYLFLNKEPDSCIRYCKQALQLQKENYAAYINLGHAYLLKGQDKQSLYYYSNGIAYVPNETVFKNGVMSDFLFFDSSNFLGFRTAPLQKLLTRLFAIYHTNLRSTALLDSISKLVLVKRKEENDDAVIEMKKAFIASAKDDTVMRIQVLRDFYFDVGIYELYKRNRAKARETYIDPAFSINSSLRDTLAEFNMRYKLAQELFVLLFAENENNKSEDALDMATRALDIADEYGFKEEKLKCLKLLGTITEKMERYPLALHYLQQLYKDATIQKDTDYIISAVSRICNNFDHLNKFDSVTYYQERFLPIVSSPLYADEYFAFQSNYVTHAYNAKKFNIAATAGIETIKRTKKAVPKKMLSNLYETTGACYYQLNKKDSALILLSKAIKLFEEYSSEFQKENDGITSFISQEKKIAFHFSRKILFEKNMKARFFEVTEKSKENSLYHLLTFKNNPDTIVPLKTIQKNLKNDEMALEFTNASDESNSLAMVFDHNNSRLIQHNYGELSKQIQVSPYRDAVLKIFKKYLKQLNTEDLALINETNTLPILYFTQISQSNQLNRGVTIKGTANDTLIGSTTLRNFISHLLYTFYIKPIEPMLSGKHTIYISTDWMLNFIPFETLMNDKGEYLGQLYSIVYVPSFTIQDLLKHRPCNTTGPLIASGNPNYKGYHPEKLSGRAYDFTRYGIKSWQELEGTKKELDIIFKQQPDALILQQSAISETVLKTMSRNSQLNKASILHFALHGLSGYGNSVDDNSLVVTEPDNGNEDGLLQFNEIYELNIAPRLVCLSACESAVGFPADDGSSESMVTAFLAAGANSIIGTNWKISDDATSLFMQEFYKQVQQHVPYPQALQTVRKKFISGVFGATFKEPYYWAPFKYYGY